MVKQAEEWEFAPKVLEPNARVAHIWRTSMCQLRVYATHESGISRSISSILLVRKGRQLAQGQARCLVIGLNWWVMNNPSVKYQWGYPRNKWGCPSNDKSHHKTGLLGVRYARTLASTSSLPQCFGSHVLLTDANKVGSPWFKHCETHIFVGLIMN